MLANFRFAVPDGVTWGDLLDADVACGFIPHVFFVGQKVVTHPTQGMYYGDRQKGQITAIREGQVELNYDHLPLENRRGGFSDRTGPPSLSLDKVVAYNQDIIDVALESWKIPDSLRHVPDLRSLVIRLQYSLFNNDALRRAPAVFLVEIQFLLEDYLLMRKDSHVWYKLVRTRAVADLVADFYSYAGIRRGSSGLLVYLVALDAAARSRKIPRAVESENGAESDDVDDAIRKMAEYWIKFNPLPKEQVVDCVEPVSGATVLHIIAMQPNGCFDFLLPGVLGIQGLNVNVRDGRGRTAHALACEHANHAAAAAIAGHPTFSEGWNALPALFSSTGGVAASTAQQGRFADSDFGGCAPANPCSSNSTKVGDATTSRLVQNTGTCSVHSKGWVDSWGWCAASKLQNWRGVTLGYEGDHVLEYEENFLQAMTMAPRANQRVTKLYLPGNGLTGHLPTELGMLRWLLELCCHNNNIQGHIPTEIGLLAQLRKLDLDSNMLTGPIPTEIGQLQTPRSEPDLDDAVIVLPARAIELLNYHNDVEAADGPKLELRLSRNRLTGTIPTQLGEVRRLVSVDLSYNLLTGHCPRHLGLARQLRQCKLHNNKLSGVFPSELCYLLHIQFVDFSNNRLTGRLPHEMEKMQRVWNVRLSENRLTGPIPTEIGAMTQLSELDLAHNGLTSTVPTEITQLQQLRYLRLNGNKLEGALPTTTLLAEVLPTTLVELRLEEGNKIRGAFSAMLLINN